MYDDKTLAKQHKYRYKPIPTAPFKTYFTWTGMKIKFMFAANIYLYFQVTLQFYKSISKSEIGNSFCQYF